MNSVTKAPISTGAKIFVWVAAVVGTLHIIDFIFYGQEIRNLLTGLGFALMAYGVHKNGFGHIRAVADRPVTDDIGGRYATNIGALLVLVSVALRFLQ
jgi:hypothetical protein